MRPEPGDLLRIDGRASVQFAGERALTFRIVSVCDRPTYVGWVWLTGYVINRRGNATAKREICVQFAGLRLASIPTTSRSRATRPAASRHNQGGGRTARDGRAQRSSRAAVHTGVTEASDGDRR
ncbi:hypothetical protein [Micromonospora sp. NPDC047740]|uniref:hypothetical protein n=1 Tax=Micromonospora sp. NPDC047740 TaxID=3364254 RepID=UPI00371202D2